MRILVFYTGELGKKVIQNLINSSSFCVSCGDLCNHCRQARKSYANMIVGIHEFPDNLLCSSSGCGKENKGKSRNRTC